MAIGIALAGPFRIARGKIGLDRLLGNGSKRRGSVVIRAADFANGIFRILIWSAAGAGATLLYYGSQLPASSDLVIPPRPPNIKIVSADGRLISNRGKTGGSVAPLDSLPYYVPEAVIAIEDHRFMDHFGIDPMGVIGALIANFRSGRIERGGSTLTQQLAKNLFLTPDQTIGRKVQEALLAIWLERNFTKEQILEFYLNRVFFGNGATGINAAAYTYFGHPARQLTLGEAATLAGLLHAPSALNPISDPAAAAARQGVVLRTMADQGYITPAEAKAATIDPNQTERVGIEHVGSYVADWVESLVHTYVGEVGQDIVVKTSLDWDLQRYASSLVRRIVADQGKTRHFSQGALVAMDPDGSVKALVGGADYQTSSYDRAITARRQPGSAFKPMVYLTALQQGYTPDSIADDAPFTYSGWSPTDDSGRYLGAVPLRKALAFSLNTVAARSGPLSGSWDLRGVAAGTDGRLRTVRERRRRRDTRRHRTYHDDRRPSALPEEPLRARTVVSPENVRMMNDMLSTVVAVGTGKAARLAGWQIAGKTGTTQQNRDALFVGYSARMITGVWLGNDDDSPTTLTGGSLPVEVWSDFMTRAHLGLTPVGLPGADTHTAGVIVDAKPQPTAPLVGARGHTLGDLLGALFGRVAN